MFYCMFYFTCDRSFTPRHSIDMRLGHWVVINEQIRILVKYDLWASALTVES